MELPNNRYTINDQLGRGAYAKVYSAKNNETGEEVAIKAIHRCPPKYELTTECRILDHIHADGKKEYVVEPLDSFTGNDQAFIVFKYLKGGDLYSRVEPKGPGLTKSQAKKWMKQLARAVKGTHERGYVHADIKPENCLLDEHDNLYLGDYGLAVPSNHTHYCSVPGTEAYMAPEMLGRGRSGVTIRKPVDIWALGITWYAMLFADLPWDAASSRDADFQSFKRTGRLPGPSKSIALLTHRLHHLLLRMLNPIPTKRASIDEVLKFLDADEPWFISRRSTNKTTKPSLAPVPATKHQKQQDAPVISPDSSKARRSSLVY